MIGLLVVIVIVLLGVLLVRSVHGVIDNVDSLTMTEATPACPPHDWWELQDDQGMEYGLICIVCQKKPEDLQ